MMMIVLIMIELKKKASQSHHNPVAPPQPGLHGAEAKDDSARGHSNPTRHKQSGETKKDVRRDGRCLGSQCFKAKQRIQELEATVDRLSQLLRLLDVKLW